MAAKKGEQKTGPEKRVRTEEEKVWCIRDFPVALKARLKKAAHKHEMALRSYVIMVLVERLREEV